MVPEPIKSLQAWQQLSQDQNKFNCSNPPIFNFIPIARVISDSLHLFLSISDQLTHQLIRDLKQLDNIANTT